MVRAPEYPSVEPAGDTGHVPVMLAEVVAFCAPRDGDLVVDGTFGGGSYSLALLAAADCRVYAIDRDEEAIARATRMAKDNPRLVPVPGRFGDMAELLREAGAPKVDAIVLDIGVSSFQIDQGERGFSFMKDGPLDMRMGGEGPTAADVVNQMSESDLADVIFRLGEERQARRIARQIVQHRVAQPFETTTQLADAVEAAVGGRRGARTHPATQTFQAIRMYVNSELCELARAMHAAEAILRPGGRLVIVTFHSLEDRMVKRWLRGRSGKMGGGSRHMPVMDAAPEATFEVTFSKAVTPSDKEVEGNPRARSAKLRSAVRTGAPPRDEAPDDGMDLPSLSDLEDAA